MALFLSEILGGPEKLDKEFDRQSTSICRLKDTYERKMLSPDDGALNVVFQYPGSLLQPEFTGVRTGSFSKKKMLLAVQVAVPADILKSDQFVAEYGRLLKEAIVVGKKFLEKKGI